jgi:Ca2+-binding RTX toxin-like protein
MPLAPATMTPISGGTGSVINLIDGGEGSDTLDGGAGNDTLTGGLGRRHRDRRGRVRISLTGGDGTDTLSYTASAAAVTVSLADGAGTLGRCSGRHLHRLRKTSPVGSFNDILTGDAGANVIDGRSGQRHHPGRRWRRYPDRQHRHRYLELCRLGRCPSPLIWRPTRSPAAMPQATPSRASRVSPAPITMTR